MIEALEEIGLPAKAEFKNGVGSILTIELAGKLGSVSIFADRCRWAVVENEELVFFDLDVSPQTDFEIFLPGLTLQHYQLLSDRLVLGFGGRDLVAFMTQDYHNFLEDGVQKDDPQWTAAPQDQKNNFTIFYSSNKASSGSEFKDFLDLSSSPWGASFAERQRGGL